MVTMDDLSKAIILLVRVGAAARFIYCMFFFHHFTQLS